MASIEPRFILLFYFEGFMLLVASFCLTWFRRSASLPEWTTVTPVQRNNEKTRTNLSWVDFLIVFMTLLKIIFKNNECSRFHFFTYLLGFFPSMKTARNKVVFLILFVRGVFINTQRRHRNARVFFFPAVKKLLHTHKNT